MLQQVESSAMTGLSCKLHIAWEATASWRKQAAGIYPFRQTAKGSEQVRLCSHPVRVQRVR